jgi:hypothetical protein
MRNLVYKELNLSISKFFYVLPLLLALLLLIPQWIYTIAFSYFFWISVSTIYSGYNAQEDLSFCSMLPVTKKDTVKSKIFAFYIIEGIHIFSGLIMVVVHNLLYGNTNFLLDLNIAFVGIIFGMYALFNIIFLPLYFKTAYKFGKPLIYASSAALIYAFIFEYGSIRFTFFREIVEGKVSNQITVLVVGIVVSIIMSYFTIKKSIANFECIE